MRFFKSSSLGSSEIKLNLEDLKHLKELHLPSLAERLLAKNSLKTFLSASYEENYQSIYEAQHLGLRPRFWCVPPDQNTHLKLSFINLRRALLNKPPIVLNSPNDWELSIWLDKLTGIDYKYLESITPKEIPFKFNFLKFSIHEINYRDQLGSRIENVINFIMPPTVINSKEYSQ